jgi:hypothetical protein
MASPERSEQLERLIDKGKGKELVRQESVYFGRLDDARVRKEKAKERVKDLIDSDPGGVNMRLSYFDSKHARQTEEAKRNLRKARWNLAKAYVGLGSKDAEEGSLSSRKVQGKEPQIAGQIYKEDAGSGSGSKKPEEDDFIRDLIKKLEEVRVKDEEGGEVTVFSGARGSSSDSK